MRELGIFLRQAREERQMTLAKAADRTKIRQAYLEAIEAGDLSSLPEDLVYVRGFVRIYAKVLGIDPDLAAKMFDEGKFPQEEPIAEYRSDSSQRQSVLEKRRALRRKRRIRFAIFVAVIAAAIAAYCYYYYYLR